MKGVYEVVCALSNDDIADDLEGPYPPQMISIFMFWVFPHIFGMAEARIFNCKASISFGVAKTPPIMCVVRATWLILKSRGPVISLERTKLDTSNLVCRLILISKTAIDYPQRGCVGSHDLCIFWEIIDNISEREQDRDIVTMKD